MAGWLAILMRGEGLERHPNTYKNLVGAVSGYSAQLHTLQATEKAYLDEQVI